MHPLDLNELLVFTRVVQAGSFTAAARALDMPKATVSRKVASLEERIGARLLQRTTRKLALTDVGRAYFERCERIVAEIEEAELAVTQMQASPRGRLRVTAPLSVDVLGSVVAGFLLRYPEVQVELVCTDRVVDLVEDGFDVAIRAGALADSTLIARRLGTFRRSLVAAPAYLETAGAPQSPSDLERHACIHFSAGQARPVWTLYAGSRSVEITVPVRLIANEYDMVREAVRAGLGVALLPDYLAVDDLRAGTLVRLLEGWSTAEVPLHAVYPSARQPAPKLMAFLEHLSAHLELVPASR